MRFGAAPWVGGVVKANPEGAGRPLLGAAGSRPSTGAQRRGGSPEASSPPTQIRKPRAWPVLPPREATFVRLSGSRLPEAGSALWHLGPVRVTLETPAPQLSLTLQSWGGGSLRGEGGAESVEEGSEEGGPSSPLRASLCAVCSCVGRPCPGQTDMEGISVAAQGQLESPEYKVSRSGVGHRPSGSRVGGRVVGHAGPSPQRDPESWLRARFPVHGLSLPPGMTSEAPLLPLPAPATAAESRDLCPQPSLPRILSLCPWPGLPPSAGPDSRPGLRPLPPVHTHRLHRQRSPTSWLSPAPEPRTLRPLELPHPSVSPPARDLTLALPLSELPKVPPLPACKSPDWWQEPSPTPIPHPTLPAGAD